MIRLMNSMKAWGTASFSDILKNEIERIDFRLLPLQEGLTQSSYAKGDKLRAKILSVSEEPRTILVRAGIFYQGIIAGCNCADDPTPVNENTEYCEIQIEIDKDTAEARIRLLQE